MTSGAVEDSSIAANLTAQDEIGYKLMTLHRAPSEGGLTDDYDGAKGGEDSGIIVLANRIKRDTGHPTRLLTSEFARL
jgi:hypothetical protein